MQESSSNVNSNLVFKKQVNEENKIELKAKKDTLDMVILYM
jgi:hypothetical protein